MVEHTLGKGRLRRRKWLFRWGISEPCRLRGNVRGYVSEKGGCGSSVVEHTLGKGEVESSILSHSTINPQKIRWLADFSAAMAALPQVTPPVNRQDSGETSSQQRKLPPLQVLANDRPQELIEFNAARTRRSRVQQLVEVD